MANFCVMCAISLMLSRCVALDDGTNNKESRILVLQTTTDIDGQQRAQTYAPPPNAVLSTSADNFGLRVFPNYAVAFCDGRVFATGGGWELRTPTDAVQVFDPKTNRQENVQPMDMKRSMHTAVGIDDSVYVCGGYGKNLHLLSHCERYNTSTKMWSPIPPMPYSIAEHKAVELEGNLYIIGGLSSNRPSPSTLLLRFNPSNGNWTRLTDMIDPRQNHFGVVAIPSRRQILVCGDMDTWKRCELYDLATNKWQRVAPMVYARIDFGMARLEHDRVLVFGGKCRERHAYHCPRSSSDNFVDVVEEYDLASNTSRLLGLPLYASGACYANAVVPP